MRFEHQGMSLWHATDDAPVTGQAMEAGARITISVGVRPANANNKVELRFRVNQGQPQTVGAEWQRSVPSAKAHYFAAQIPGLREGDKVEYSAVCRCAGRQVPARDEPEQFCACFSITGLEKERVHILPVLSGDVPGSERITTSAPVVNVLNGPDKDSIRLEDP